MFYRFCEELICFLPNIQSLFCFILLPMVSNDFFNALVIHRVYVVLGLMSNYLARRFYLETKSFDFINVYGQTLLKFCMSVRAIQFVFGLCEKASANCHPKHFALCSICLQQFRLQCSLLFKFPLGYHSVSLPKPRQLS